MRSIVLAALATSVLALSACAGGTDDDATAEATASEAAPAPAAAEAATTVLDPNAATAEQLAVIEGMSPELAAAIVAGKPYASASAFNAELLETLSPDEAARVRTAVFVPINLNTASEADIKLIPGMTDKMVHEFLEYRPYVDMAEFDREIGKYVDAAEVARLRTYVTL
jgi:DNA uptake protein ComE-like DNA-binding protein